MNPFYYRNSKRRFLPYSGNKYEIDKDGRIYLGNSTEPMPTYHDEMKNIMVDIDWLDGYRPYKLAELVAHTFKYSYVDFPNKLDLKVGFDDGNQWNLHPSNLYWYLEKPSESKAFLGWYIIPNFSRYLINKEGQVMPVLGRAIKEGWNAGGYLSVRLKRDFGNDVHVGIHRLLALAFLNPGGPIDSMVINHKDGNKMNNSLDNLEWTDRAGNALHAVRHPSLDVFRHTPDKVVLARDVFTGKELSFPSARAAARHFNINLKTMQHRLNAGKMRVFFPGYQFKRAKDEDIPWRIPTEEEIKNIKPLKKGRYDKIIKAINVQTGEVRLFDTIKRASLELGISHSTLGADLTGQIPHKVRVGWDVQILEESSES